VHDQSHWVEGIGVRAVGYFLSTINIISSDKEGLTVSTVVLVVKGEKGEKGKTGEKGVKGVKGEKGVKAVKGVKGVMVGVVDIFVVKIMPFSASKKLQDSF
jgi:hypothetical protein